jgi:hypothetical protein
MGNARYGAMLGLCFFLVSCGKSTEDPAAAMSNFTKMYPRIRMFSQDSEVSEITVELESYAGELLNGAVVLAHNTANSVKKLDYDVNSGAFKTTYPIPEDGIVYISIKSVILDSILHYTIAHKQVLAKPAIVVFEDSAGKSVLAGHVIDAMLDLKIGWTTVEEGIIYQVLIKDAVSTLYEEATEASHITIPAGTLRAAAGTTYNVQIVAQRLYGDPFFIRENYYSASLLTGERLNFNVQ